MTLRFARLNRAGIRRLKIGERIGEHGIIAERLSDGDVRVSVNVMAGGRRVHRVVGAESAGVTRYQAEQLVEKIKTDARADRLDLPKARKVHLTFARAASDYIKQLEETAGKNIRVKEAHFRLRLVPALGTKRLAAISQLDVERFKRDRVAAGAATATVNRELATLGHLLAKALEWNWLDHIPVKLQKFREENRRITVLDDSEIDRLLQAAIAGPDPDLWLFIEVGRNTGMRHHEIVKIRWADCDLASRRIFIPQAKAGSRQQPIPQGLADILKREQAMRADREGHIFPARSRRSAKPHIKSFEDQFRRAVIDAGFDPKIVTPHVLRHTAITKLVQSGIDLITVMKISGHKSLKMVQRYAHVSEPHIDKAIAVLDRKAAR
jgi:integrase